MYRVGGQFQTGAIFRYYNSKAKRVTDLQTQLAERTLFVASAELKITSGQRSISVQISVMATQIIAHLVIMSRQNFEECMI